MKREVILDAILCAIILLFVYTAMAKYLNWNQFKFDMHNQIFSDRIAHTLIRFVPPIEILIAILLLFRKTRNIGLYTSTITMLAFTTYTALVLFHFFPRVPCSCGGVIRNLTWTQHLLLNLFYLGISILGIYLNKKNTYSNYLATSAI